MGEKEKCREEKKNINARLSSSNMGEYLFSAELVNNTVVRKALPMHAMKTCG